MLTKLTICLLFIEKYLLNGFIYIKDFDKIFLSNVEK